jgi:putative surface layer protein sapB11
MAVTQAEVAQLYVALFNRAPEGAGFKAWINFGHNKTQAEIAQLMLESPAAIEYYGGRIDQDKDYIELIYKNILGKDYTKDPDGINAWVKHLQLGHSRGETLVKLFEVAQSAEAKAADPVAAKIFENKTAISAYMAEKIANIETSVSGSYDYKPFQEIIKTTTDTNYEEQKAKIDALAASTVHTLTTEPNDLTGGVGQDIFNAVADSFVATNTLKPTDKIDGGMGENTLNVTVKDNFNGMTTGFIKNIDNLNLTSTATTQKTFNARNIEGLKKVSLDSQNGINFINPHNLVDLTIENLKSSTESFKLNYNTGTIAGTNDTQNLTLDNVNLHKKAIDNVVGVDGTGIDIPNIENLNIATKGEKSTVFIKSGDNTNHYKTISVKGTTDVKLMVESDRLEKVDASAFTHNLEYEFNPSQHTPIGATNVIKGGSGNDTIKLDFKDVDATNKTNFDIDGGAGKDTLNIERLKAKENKFTVNNMEKVNIQKVDTGTPNDTASIDFAGSDVTALNTTKTKSNLVVTNSTIKSVTVDKPDPENTDVASGPYGRVEFKNGYLQEINITNTIDPQDVNGNAIINAVTPGLRSQVTAYVAADESERVTVNVDKNVYAQKIGGAGATAAWVDSNKMHANEGIGIIAPKAKDITVNFNSIGTYGNSVANITGMSLTNIAVHDLSSTIPLPPKTLEKLTVNSKSSILSNLDATFFEKLKAFNINTDDNFDAYGTREFNDIEQINARGLASNNIKTGNVYFVDNIIGKGTSAAATATQSIAITAEHLNSFKASKGVFTKGSISVTLNDIGGNVEMVKGINNITTAANNPTTGSTMKNYFDSTPTTWNFQYATADNSIVTEGTFSVNGNNITNLLIGNIAARDIEINPGNARGNVSIASGGGQYTSSSSYANSVGKVGNDKTINNTIDMSQMAGSYNIGELFGQNVNFKGAVFTRPTHYSPEIDTGLESDRWNTGQGSTPNAIKVNFGGARTGTNPGDKQDVVNLNVSGVQTGEKTDVYVKFDDGTASPNDLKKFVAKGENINLIVNPKFNAATTSKLETIDLSEVKAGSTSWVNLSEVPYSTDTTSHSGGTKQGYSSWHNSTANQGFGNAGNSNLKNPLSDNYATPTPTNNFKATSTLPDFGARTGVTGNDAPNFTGNKWSHKNVDGSSTSLTRPSTELVRQKSDLGTNAHEKLKEIKGTQGNDVVLLANDMAANNGTGKLNVDLGDGDDIIHVGTLAANTEIIIDGGKGRDLFDVSRAKTDATVSKIVTIKNIEAGDRIKLADWFAHGYDPKDPSGDNKDSSWGAVQTYGSDKVQFYAGNHPDASTSAAAHGQTFSTARGTANADSTTPPLTITGTTSGNATSTVHGYDTPTGTAAFEENLQQTPVASNPPNGGHWGGDRYQYKANHGDFAWQTGNAAAAAASTNIATDASGNRGFNNSTSPFYEPGKAAVEATKSATVTGADAGQSVPSAWTLGTPPTPLDPNGLAWATWSVAQVGGGTASYYANNGTAAPFTGLTMKKQGNLLYDTTKHTEVSGVMYYNTYTDVNQVAGGGSQQGTPISAHGKVVIQNSGVASTKSANAGAITANDLIKSVIVQTSTNSDKYTGGISANDQSFYDAHNTIKVTVNSKLTDLTTVAGLDTLIQAVNHAIKDNILWGNDTTYWTANYAYFNKFADANSTSTTSDNVVMGYTRTISASGNYDAHNDRLYAFSWKGDTYLVYDKEAKALGSVNSIGPEDTIVRLAGVNLENLKYTVDPEKGTITIDSLDQA